MHIYIYPTYISYISYISNPTNLAPTYFLRLWLLGILKRSTGTMSMLSGSRGIFSGPWLVDAMPLVGEMLENCWRFCFFFNGYGFCVVLLFFFCFSGPVETRSQRLSFSRMDGFEKLRKHQEAVMLLF